MTAKNVARRPKKFFGNNFPLKSAAVAVFRVAILQSDFLALQDCGLLQRCSLTSDSCCIVEFLSKSVRNSAPSLTISLDYLLIYRNVVWGFLKSVMDS